MNEITGKVVSVFGIGQARAIRVAACQQQHQIPITNVAQNLRPRIALGVECVLRFDTPESAPVVVALDGIKVHVEHCPPLRTPANQMEQRQNPRSKSVHAAAKSPIVKVAPVRTSQICQCKDLGTSEYAVIACTTNIVALYNKSGWSCLVRAHPLSFKMYDIIKNLKIREGVFLNEYRPVIGKQLSLPTKDNQERTLEDLCDEEIILKVKQDMKHYAKLHIMDELAIVIQPLLLVLEVLTMRKNVILPQVDLRKLSCDACACAQAMFNANDAHRGIMIDTAHEVSQADLSSNDAAIAISVAAKFLRNTVKTVITKIKERLVVACLQLQ